MKSGRELDAEVAERVMGWTIAPEGDRWRVSATGDYCNSWSVDSPNLADLDDDINDRVYGRYAMPRYSESIEAAMQVVQQMRERGYGWTICTHKDGWFVRCFELPDEGLQWRHSTVVKESLAEALCLSALAALEESRIAKEKCGLAAIE